MFCLHQSPHSCHFCPLICQVGIARKKLIFFLPTARAGLGGVFALQQGVWKELGCLLDQGNFQEVPDLILSPFLPPWMGERATRCIFVVFEQPALKCLSFAPSSLVRGRSSCLPIFAGFPCPKRDAK